MVGPANGVARHTMKRRLDSIIIGGAMLFGGMAHRRADHVARQVDELGEAHRGRGGAAARDRRAPGRAPADPRHAAADRLRPARCAAPTTRASSSPSACRRASSSRRWCSAPSSCRARRRRPRRRRCGARPAPQRLARSPPRRPRARTRAGDRSVPTLAPMRERLSGTLQYVFGNDPGFSIDETFGGAVDAAEPRGVAQLAPERRRDAPPLKLLA